MLTLSKIPGRSFFQTARAASWFVSFLSNSATYQRPVVPDEDLLKKTLPVHFTIFRLILHDVVRATTVAQLFDAAPAWWGLQDRRLNSSVMNRLIRHRYLPDKNSTFERLCQEAYISLFSATLSDLSHVLHGFTTI